MRCWKKKVLIMIVSTFFIITLVTTPTLAQDPRSELSGTAMAFDFVVLRPLGIATTVIGCGFFVVTLPFTVWSKKRIKHSGYAFVVEPASYTFVRPLGKSSSASDEEQD